MADIIRMFEYKADNQTEFWEITKSGNTVRVRFGKAGTSGQCQEKVLADAATATEHLQKLILEMAGKGYVEQRAGTSPMYSADANDALVVRKATKSRTQNTQARSKSLASSTPKSPVKDPDASPESLTALLDLDETTNRLIAKHPRASAAILEKLAHSSDKATRYAVAGNPNTPSKVLQKLGAQFPTQLLRNPALDLMILENPGLFSEIPKETLAALAKRDDCSPDMLGHLARVGHGKGMLMSLLQNGATPKSAIEYLMNSSAEVIAERYDEYEDEIRIIKRLVPMHVAVAGSMSLQQAEDRFWLDLSVRLGLSQDFEWVLSSSADIPEPVLHDAIAFALLDRPRPLPIKLPSALLELIATKVDKRTLTALKAIENYPEYLKEAKNSGEVVTLILKNSSSEDIEWNNLLKTESLLMRLLLCGHPKYVGHWDKEDLMLKLAVLPNEILWRLLAEMPNLSEKVGNLLLDNAISSESFVLICLAGNKTISPSVLTRLHQEYNSRGCWNTLNAMAGNPVIPGVILDEIFLSPGKIDNMKYSLAENPSVSAERLDFLFKKSDLYNDYPLYSALIRNPNCPPELLKRIAQKDTNDYYYYHSSLIKLLKHKNATTEVFDLLVANLSQKEFSRHDVNLLQKFAGDPRISPYVMTKIISSKWTSQQTKIKILKNKSVTFDVLKLLSTDKDPEVQKAARIVMKKMKPKDSMGVN